MERTIETAGPLADRLGLEIQKSEDFTEIDVGDWSGVDINQLTREPLWQAYNTFRSGIRPPNGELIIEVQQRMVFGIKKLRRKHPQGTVAVFSHADPIKAVLAYYAGMPVDFITRTGNKPCLDQHYFSDGDRAPAKILGINCGGGVPPLAISQAHPPAGCAGGEAIALGGFKRRPLKP